MGGPENGNLPLLYVVKMSLRRWRVVQKSLKIPLRNIKMAPYQPTVVKLTNDLRNEHVKPHRFEISCHTNDT